MTNELIINYKEKYLEIVNALKTFNNINIKKVIQFYPQDGNRVEGLLYNNEDNIGSFKKLLEENSIKNKKAKLILSIDGIITRLIEVPYMKKSDLDNYIKNNIKEYFTVSIEDYYFDYRITDIEEDERKKFNLLLAAVPRSRVDDMAGLLKAIGIEIKKIDIYPNCISRLYNGLKNIDTAIFDTDSDKSKLTILTKNRIFLYSNINTEIDNDEDFQEIFDNLGYFLNFYSSRNFGKRLDSIYLLGRFGKNEKLRYSLATQFDMEVYEGFKETKLKVEVPEGMIESQFADVLGLLSRKKNIYNKDIDFSDRINVENRDKFKAILIPLTSILLSITFGWTAIAFFYVRKGMAYYDTSGLDREINNLNYIEGQINNLNKVKSEYENKEKFMKEMDNDNFDYLTILETLRKGVPGSVKIKTITMDKDNVNTTFEITDGSTLDAARLTIAINKMGIFEPVEISDIKLDDTVNEMNFSLKLKKLQ